MVRLFVALGIFVLGLTGYLLSFTGSTPPAPAVPQSGSGEIGPKISQVPYESAATSTKAEIRSSAPMVLPRPDVPPKTLPKEPQAPAPEAVLILPPSAPPPAVLNAATSAPPSSPPLPPLDEVAIFRAVVKIECPSEDRRGKYVGSGFLLPKGVVVTAAHLLMASGSETCQVIFPKDRYPGHYLSGVIKEDRLEIKRRHDEEGIDVAVLFMPLLAAYPEASAIFPERYPYIPYPICGAPAVIGDKLLHFGYPSSFLGQSYLAKAEGQAVLYADIKGIEERLNEDQTELFKTPIFGYTSDQSDFHPYLVSRVATFYGDSGGLAFNASKQCILGPHRGGTIGGAAGENFSVFTVLGWEGAKAVLPPS